MLKNPKWKRKQERRRKKKSGTYKEKERYDKPFCYLITEDQIIVGFQNPVNHIYIIE